MVPAFGFSVGDFIAAADLIAKVVKALKNKGGASIEYQHVQIELEALARTLQHLEAMEPTESNTAHVNAIRGMALACRIPLQDFLSKIEKFERTMGAFAKVSVTSAKTFGRKSQWAVFMSEEVAKLRTAVGAKVLSINLLLATHTSESISRVEANARKSHATLMANVLDLRSQAIRANEVFRNTQHKVNIAARKQARDSRHTKKVINTVAETLRDVSGKAASTNASIMSLRDVGTQLLQIISEMPQQIRNTLEQIVKSNLEMYAMLRTIQNSLARSPETNRADTFTFEDVLGRSRPLPYEFFRHIDVFRAFLVNEFQGVPGERQVLKRQYSIMDTRRGDAPISEAEWGTVVFPGANIVMSVLVEALIANGTSTLKCPRASCTGIGVVQEGRKSFLTCDQCDLQFLQRTRGLKPARTPRAARPNRNDMGLSRGSPKEATPAQSGQAISETQSDGPSDAIEASSFWAGIQDIDKTRRELDAFRRVHISNSADFDSIRSSDASLYEPFDVLHVQNKLPDIEEFQAVRLGRAITRRRHFLAYSRRTRSTLFELSPDEGTRSLSHLEMNDTSSRVASFTSSGLVEDGEIVTLGPTQRITKIFQWIVAESVRYGKEAQIECPLCFRFLKSEHPLGWKKHFMKDLRPYICLHKRCAAAEQLFESWDALTSHCKTAHGDSAIRYSHSSSCPLDESGQFCDRCAFIRKDMEELALFALPGSMREDDSDLDDEDSWYGDGDITIRSPSIESSQGEDWDLSPLHEQRKASSI